MRARLRRLARWGLNETLFLVASSCGAAACDEPVDPAPPPVAVVAPTVEPAPEPEPEAPSEPDLASDDALLGVIEVAPGFVPDPMSRVATTRGGPVDAHAWDDRCDGWIARDPDAIVEVARPFAELSVMVASEAATTLVIVGPDGEPRCASGEGHPRVHRAFAAGTHRVWVGARERDATERYVLSLSEMDDTEPADTLD